MGGVEGLSGQENEEKIIKTEVSTEDLKNQEGFQKTANEAKKLGDTAQIVSSKEADALLKDLNGNGKIDENDLHLHMFEVEWDKGFNTIEERRDYLVSLFKNARENGTLNELASSVKQELDTRHIELSKKGGVNIFPEGTGDLKDMYKLMTGETYHMPGYEEMPQNEVDKYNAELMSLDLTSNEGQKKAVKIIDAVKGHVDGYFSEICARLSNGKITPTIYRKWKFGEKK